MALRLVIMSQDVPNHCRVIDYFSETKFMEIKNTSFSTNSSIASRGSLCPDYQTTVLQMLFSRISLLFTSFYFRACYLPLPDNTCAWMNLTLMYIDYLNEDLSLSLPPPFLLSLVIHSKHSQNRNYFCRTEITLKDISQWSFAQSKSTQMTNDRSIGTSEFFTSNDSYVFYFS